VVTYQHGTSWVRAPCSFGLFLPPFEIVQASLERCDVHVRGYRVPTTRIR
jgi:hypothetical protein